MIKNLVAALLAAMAVFGTAQAGETPFPTKTMLDNAIVQTGDTSRLHAAMQKALRDGEITIAFLGGSITYGAGGQGKDTYAKVVEGWLQKTFPQAEIRSINAGMSGTDSIVGIHRLKADVLSQRPDIVFVEYAVNDGVDAEGNLIDIEHRYSFDAVVREILQTGAAAVPVFCCVRGGYSSQADKQLTGEYYALPMVSYRDAIMPEIEKGLLDWNKLTKDGVHPNKAGHRLLGALVSNLMQEVYAGISGQADILPVPEPLYGIHYAQAETIMAGDPRVTAPGSFAEGTRHWLYKNGFAATGLDAPLTIKLVCKTIRVLVNRTTDNTAAAFNVYVDGEFTQRFNTKADGIYEQLTGIPIYSSDTPGQHTVEIFLSNENPEGCTGTNSELLAFLISQ